MSKALRTVGGAEGEAACWKRLKTLTRAPTWPGHPPLGPRPGGLNAGSAGGQCAPSSQQRRPAGGGKGAQTPTHTRCVIQLEKGQESCRRLHG